MGIIKLGFITSSETVNLALYITSFSKNTTGFGSLTAAWNNPIQSSTSYGATVIRPGTEAYQAAKH